jgi:hypothetical protein
MELLARVQDLDLNAVLIPQRDFVTVARVLHSISQYYLAMPLVFF